MQYMEVFMLSEMRFCTQTDSREDQAGFSNLDILAAVGRK